MRSILCEEVPVVIEDGGVEVRLSDEAGLSVGVRAAASGRRSAPCHEGPAGRPPPVSPLGLHDQGPRAHAHARRTSGFCRWRCVLLGARACAGGAWGL